MNSKVIKFVAGAGKTTISYEYLRENRNGLYLAFNNDVVRDISNKGLLGKTIDSLFQSFIIPKFISCIPLIGSNKKVSYIDSAKLPKNLKGVANIKIDLQGNIKNQSKPTSVNLKMSNAQLHSMGNFLNSFFIKHIFSKNELRLTNELRAELADYIITNYPDQVVSLLKSRFSYIIIDEAQDLKGYREKFGRLLFNSDIKLFILGDDNQNINGGGTWFESLSADDVKKISHRCPDSNCKWIRENLDIDIQGNDRVSNFELITYEQVLSLDDGKRVLLYHSNSGQNKDIIANWKGFKFTIKGAKGSTIDNDIVIIGKSLQKKNLYTAITRTRANVYSTVAYNI